MCVGSGMRGGRARPDIRHPRETEIEHLRVAVAAHHDVLGLDVTVHDPRGVRGRERPRDLPADVEQRRNRDLSSHLRAERLAADELLHDVVAAFGCLADVVYDDDVGMVEGGGGARFPKEAMNGLTDLPFGIAHQLDGDRTLQPRVDRAIHLAHAPAADQFFETIMMNGCVLHRHTTARS